MSTLVTEKIGGATVRYLGVVRPGIEKSMTDAVHEAAEATVRYWRKEYGWRHFNMNAHRRYGGKMPHVFEPRRGPMKWMVRRWNTPDDVIPLVSKGTLRQAFLGGALKLTRTGQGQQATVRASWPSLPRYAYMFDPNYVPDFAQRYAAKRGRGLSDKPMHPLRHAMYLELTIINEDEAADLRAYFGQKLETLLNQKGD